MCVGGPKVVVGGGSSDTFRSGFEGQGLAGGGSFFPGVARKQLTILMLEERTGTEEETVLRGCVTRLGLLPGSTCRPAVHSS